MRGHGVTTCYRDASGTVRRAARFPWWVYVASPVLLLDLLLLGAHCLHQLGEVTDPGRNWALVFRRPSQWNGGWDGSFIEFFGHIQLAAAGLLLIFLALRTPGHRILLAWGGIFLIMTADDFLQVHESVGALLGEEAFGSRSARAQELGGLAFWGVTGLVLGAGLVVGHLKSCSAARHESWGLLVITTPLVLVAVGYVLVSMLGSELFEGPAGTALIFVRVTVKLLTMTLLLTQALRLAVSLP